MSSKAVRTLTSSRLRSQRSETSLPDQVPIPRQEFQIVIDVLEGRYELIAVPELKNLLRKLGQNFDSKAKKGDLVLLLLTAVAEMNVVPAEVIEEAFSVPQGESMPAARPVNKGAAAARTSKRAEAVWEHEGLFPLVLRSMLETHYIIKRR